MASVGVVYVVIRDNNGDSSSRGLIVVCTDDSESSIVARVT